MFRKRVVDEYKIIEYIYDKLIQENTNVTKEDVERILDLELEYLIKMGIAK